MQNNREKRKNLFVSNFNDFNIKKVINANKKELMSDAIDELNWKITQISIGEIIKVVYFEKGKYILLSGIVNYIDLEYRKEIQISKKKIPVKNIISLDSLL